MNIKKLINSSLRRKRLIFLQLILLATVLFLCGITPIKAQGIVYDTAKPVNDTIYPEFKGGEEARQRFIMLKSVYPTEALKKGIQGTVMVSFIVEVNGRITNVKVVDSVHPLLDAEAVRVARIMPKWIPGKYQGKAVRTPHYMPMKFVVDGAQELADVFHKVENPPEFRGGEDSLQKFLNEFLRENNDYYSLMAQRMEMSGTVFVSFVVEKDGRISNIKIIKGGPSLTLDKEAFRIVKLMPKWDPGTIGGEAVRAWYDMLIRFTFSNDNDLYTYYYLEIKKRDK